VYPVSRPQVELTAHQNVIAENAALRAELAASKAANATMSKAKLRATKATKARPVRRRVTAGG
jgi:hypothetical protein